MATFNPILSYPEYNGHRLSRTSCVLRVAPVVGPPLVVAGWKSITAGEELTIGETYGNRAKMQGRTRGRHKPTFELELYVEDAEKLRVLLGAAGQTVGMGWGEVSASYILTASEKALGGSFLWEALGGRAIKDELAISDNGDDQLSRKWTVHCADMRQNGLSMVLENTPFGLPNV